MPIEADPPVGIRLLNASLDVFPVEAQDEGGDE